jgi:flagellar biosynthesis/type III secretory pathway protein FliH
MNTEAVNAIRYALQTEGIEVDAFAAEALHNQLIRDGWELYSTQEVSDFEEEAYARGYDDGYIDGFSEGKEEAHNEVRETV